jgi:prophage tail gpP-like protein
MATKRKRYSVWAKTNVYNSIEILAESLEDAVAQSKELKTADFVEILGDNMDSDTIINGVMES